MNNLDTTGSPIGGNASLNRCNVSIALGSLSCDSDDYSLEPESDVSSRPKRIPKRTKLPYVMRESCFGRRRGWEPEALTKTMARVSLAEYTSLKASLDPDSTPAYDLLMNPKPPAHSITRGLETTRVLLDTGASISLMPSWQAAKLKLEVKPQTDIVVRGANGRPLTIEGVTELFAQDPEAMFWKKIKLIMTRLGNWTLISPRDQKRLLLLSKTYPRFLGEGRQQRSRIVRLRTCRRGSDSSSDSDSDCQSECEMDIEICTAYLVVIDFNQKTH